MGVDSHVSITWWFLGGEGGGAGSPRCKHSPSLYFTVYHFSIRLYKTPFLLTTHSNFSVLNFKLGVHTNYPLARMFFFRIVATAFPTSYRMKTVCSCWVWKLSNDACLLNVVPSASFLTQSDWLEKKADQSLCVRKEAMGTRWMPTKTMVRRYGIGNA